MAQEAGGGWKDQLLKLKVRDNRGFKVQCGSKSWGGPPILLARSELLWCGPPNAKINLTSLTSHLHWGLFYYMHININLNLTFEYKPYFNLYV